MNNSITLDQAKSKVLEMNNETLENFVNQRKGNDSELSNFARNELADRNSFNFYDDAEKMSDFKKLSKEEFLKSYSYLTEQEYDNTKMVDDLKVWQDGSLINTDAINKLSLGDLERVAKILDKVK
tara:strand:+ start:141 stop:515 length:375 start_codon:yes stop_codon:yes gene_type:complete